MVGMKALLKAVLMVALTGFFLVGMMAGSLALEKVYKSVVLRAGPRVAMLLKLLAGN